MARLIDAGTVLEPAVQLLLESLACLLQFATAPSSNWLRGFDCSALCSTLALRLRSTGSIACRSPWIFFEDLWHILNALNSVDRPLYTSERYRKKTKYTSGDSEGIHCDFDFAMTGTTRMKDRSDEVNRASRRPVSARPWRGQALSVTANPGSECAAPHTVRCRSLAEVQVGSRFPERIASTRAPISRTDGCYPAVLDLFPVAEHDQASCEVSKAANCYPEVHRAWRHRSIMLSAPTTCRPSRGCF